MENTWYVIVNPISGNGTPRKKWKRIISSFDSHHLLYTFTFSDYINHEKELVQHALKQGYRKFICVGGDGTLHQVVNGIMTQNTVNLSDIKVAIIPMGTGNDWVKTYNIPKNISKAVSIIKREKTIHQDIGYLELLNDTKKVYFNNLAGLGFDGFVIKNSLKYKKYGALSYLLATLKTFLHYKKSVLTIDFNNKIIYSKALLALVGICKYSGGGMQLTKDVNTTDGLFDISIAKNFNFVSILSNIIKFYNGNMVNHKEVETYKTANIKITTYDNTTFVEADGELIGTGGFKATIIPKAIPFIIP